MGHLSRISILGDNPKAAHLASWLANCGCQVNLLGVVAKSTFDLEPIAKSCLYVPEFQSRLKVGLVRDNIDQLRKSTWILDCHSANADIKDSLYSVIDSVIAPDAVITTDDTLLPLSTYTDKRSSLLAKRFFVLQFAEPLTRPELAEYAMTEQTDAQKAEALVRELYDVAGVRCLPTPYCLGLTVHRAALLYCMQAIAIAERLQLDVDLADRYAEALGLMQAFRFVDASVFNDTIAYCTTLCREYGLSGLPRSLRALYEDPKRSRGFYSAESGQSVVLDLQTLAYRGAADDQDANFERIKRLPKDERMAAALAVSGPFGEYAREASKAIGTLASLLRRSRPIDDEHLQLALQFGVGIRTAPRPSSEAPTTPAVDTIIQVPFTISVQQARELTERIVSLGREPFILVGSEDGFCGGIDAEELLKIIGKGGQEGLVDYCVAFQRLTRALHGAHCVAAVHGVCLGLGLELALACAKVVADAGTRIGMDYARYGLMPIAGGSIRLRLIGQSEGARRLAELAHILALGKCAGNAYEAQRLGLFPKASEVVANRRKLLESASRWLASLPAREEQEWLAIAGPLAGMIDQIKASAKQRGEIGQHGEALMEKAKALMTKPLSISAAQDLETETFLDLAPRALSQARMRYTISSGKALNN